MRDAEGEGSGGLADSQFRQNCGGPTGAKALPAKRPFVVTGDEMDSIQEKIKGLTPAEQQWILFLTPKPNGPRRAKSSEDLGALLAEPEA